MCHDLNMGSENQTSEDQCIFSISWGEKMSAVWRHRRVTLLRCPKPNRYSREALPAQWWRRISNPQVRNTRSVHPRGTCRIAGVKVEERRSIEPSLGVHSSIWSSFMRELLGFTWASTVEPVESPLFAMFISLRRLEILRGLGIQDSLPSVKTICPLLFIDSANRLEDRETHSRSEWEIYTHFQWMFVHVNID